MGREGLTKEIATKAEERKMKADKPAKEQLQKTKEKDYKLYGDETAAERAARLAKMADEKARLRAHEAKEKRRERMYKTTAPVILNWKDQTDAMKKDHAKAGKVAQATKAKAAEMNIHMEEKLTAWKAFMLNKPDSVKKNGAPKKTPQQV